MRWVMRGLAVMAIATAATTSGTERSLPGALGRWAHCDAESWHQCGVQVGTQMRSTIAHVVSHDSTTGQLLAWAATRNGTRILAEYEAVHRAIYPDLIEELEGLAVGSLVPFQTLLIVNLVNELVWPAGLAHDGVGRGIRSHKGCSDYHIATDSTAAWGHTEDGEATFINSTYMVTSNVTVGGVAHGYTAFVYPGTLAGWAWGVNAHGVAMSVNALTVPTTKVGLGVAFVARSVLGAASLDDAINRASVKGQASGQHFNLGAPAAPPLLSTPLQISVETSPNGVTLQPISKVAGGRYQHFNQYLHTSGMPRIGDYESSIHRLARASQFSTSSAPPAVPGDIRTVLSDTADERYPIYRSFEHGTHSTFDPYITQTTTLFDLGAGVVSIWAGSTSAASPPDFTFNISH
eukprot:m.64290 g.64290  ORF g.64290 m.64290 type:complete len:406 (+) comp17862_c0_seq1:25-1242(+)